jgi:protein-disulfide isomerase
MLVKSARFGQSIIYCAHRRYGDDMKRSILSAALVFCLSTQAYALDLAELSDDERAAFRDEVRAYLLENPDIIVEAMQVLKDRQAAAEAENDIALVKDNATSLFDSSTDWVGGNKSGDITIVEFMDYQCGYCKKAHAEVAELIKSDGNIRFVLKEYPILGDASDLAARFAIAVRLIGGDDAYEIAHNELMTLRGEIGAAAFDRIAKDIGLDPAAVNAQMQTPEVAAVIDANRTLGDAMQINGTPTFVIDQTLLRGYVPLDGMRQVVAEERNG